MAEAMLLLPKTAPLELSFQLRNGGELRSGGLASSRGFRIRGRDCCLAAVQGIGRMAGAESRANRSGISMRLDGEGNHGILARVCSLDKSALCLSNCEGSDSRRQPAMARSGSVDENQGFGFVVRPASVESGNRSQPAATKNKTSVGVLFGSVLLAVGFGALRFCRPAYAEPVVEPPTLSAPLNVNQEEEHGRESKTSEAEDQSGDKESAEVVVPEGTVKAEDHVGSKKEGGDEAFEPPYGEGSDLTNDPAEVLLRSYLEMHPGDIKALQALLFLRLKKGEVDAALPVLKTLIELEPDNLEWKYIRAQADEYAGDLDEARRGFEEILQTKPLSARAWQGLAVIMHKTGEDEEALQLLMDAVKAAVDGGQSKEALNLRMLLGQLHTMQGNLEKAMELYKIVGEEDPQDYRPYLCQGLVYSIIGEEAEAEKYFRRYRKLCPKDFPQRGFLDEILLRAKTESSKLNKRTKEVDELKKKGKKVPKVMRQPLASGAAPLSRENEKAP